MGLSVSLANALAGMELNQRGLSVVSRNVANSGSPGYHRQRLAAVEGQGVRSSNVRASTVQRAYDLSLETQTYRETSRMGDYSVKNDFLNRVDQVLGKPGSVNSLDKQLSNFKSFLQALATSPESVVARPELLHGAQSMAETLNSMAVSTQAMRSEVESQITIHVSGVNQNLQSLAEINQDLMDTPDGDESRVSLMDERDRLIAGISELIDVRVEHRGDGTVALQTRSGAGLLDFKPAQLEFSSAGGLSANALFDRDSDKSGVGELKLVSSSGLELDVVGNGILRSGKINGLIDLRDRYLVTLQDQLDEIAAALAQAMNTVETQGTAVTAGAASGFEADTADIQPGNYLELEYVEDGTTKSVQVVRVDDADKLPMDQVGLDGVRTIGLDFSSGTGAVATALSSALGSGVTVSNPSGTMLRFVDDGSVGTTDITSVKTFHTVTANQGAGVALSLFTDQLGKPFTNSLDGEPQKRGFAARISLNNSLVADNSLLVKYDTNAASGDATRPNYLLDQLQNMQFLTETDSDLYPGDLRISGDVGDLVSQILNYQGNVISSTRQAHASQKVVMQTIEQRAEAAYGVNMDREMTMLLELQSAYAANARVVSIAKELIDVLMRI